jgi:hypothetical protein
LVWRILLQTQAIPFDVLLLPGLLMLELMCPIMRHRGWKFLTDAEGYVEASVESKNQIAVQILGDQNSPLNKVQKVLHESSSSMIDITSTSPGTTFP